VESLLLRKIFYQFNTFKGKAENPGLRLTIRQRRLYFGRFMAMQPASTGTCWLVASVSQNSQHKACALYYIYIYLSNKSKVNLTFLCAFFV